MTEIDYSLADTFMAVFGFKRVKRKGKHDNAGTHGNHASMDGRSTNSSAVTRKMDGCRKERRTYMDERQLPHKAKMRQNQRISV